ncbi:MAG: hypothetical protein FWG50_05225 [Kiritimatiellaeota bacterium]|nr:hypothetical protein [Kiritimatiellota bacterium]
MPGAQGFRLANNSRAEALRSRRVSDFYADNAFNMVFTSLSTLCLTARGDARPPS